MCKALHAVVQLPHLPPNFGNRLATSRQDSVTFACARRSRGMTQPHVYGQAALAVLPPEEVIFGHSPQMAVARTKLLLAADTNIPVLLQGNSGTGKEILAQLLHIRSHRSRFPWIKVTCPAIPDSLIESELF